MNTYVNVNKFNITINSNKKKGLLKKNKNECYFCKKIFNKYMYLTSYKNKETLCCKMCYMITTCDHNIDSLLLCYSELSQSEIVKKTVTFIKEFRRVPKVIEIDSKAKDINLSLLELVFILKNKKTLPKIMNNYKIFFGPKFNKDYLLNMDGFMFDSDEEIDLKIYENQLNKLDEYKMNKEDYDYIYNIIYTN